MVTATAPSPNHTVPPEIERQTIGELVPVGLLFHDMAYSRGVSERLVQKMGSMFDANAVGVLLVSLRPDGRYAVLDGCHRHGAAVAAGVERLPCRVYLDLSVADEAALFTRFNRDRRRMTTGEVFHARLAAHDPQALDIQRIVRQCKLELTLNGGLQNGHIQAIGALELIYTTHGPEGLREILSLAIEAWGQNEPRAFTATVLRGLMSFWIRYREYINRSRLIDRLRLAGPTQLLSNSSAFRKVVIGIAPEQALGRAVLGIYNSGLPEKSRLTEWQSRVYGDVTRATLPAKARAGHVARKARLAA